MLLKRWLTGIGLGLSLVPVMGQGPMSSPDMELSALYPVDKDQRVRSVSPNADLSADLKWFCDGDYLFLYLHIRDEDLHLDAKSDFSDHVELWLALPDESFPSDFAYDFHPNYVVGQNPLSRSQDDYEPRFFSIYSEYANELELRPFQEDYDYEREAGQEMPPSQNLRLDQVHFGLMRYALFADERPAELLNRTELFPVEDALKASLGDVEQGIQYQVTHHEQGEYEINVRISPQALGFIQLPEMRELAVMVDVHDTDYRGRRAEAKLSSSPYRSEHGASPSDFNQIRFQVPFYTNFTTIPDQLFHEAGYFPLCFYSRQDWIGTGIDVDAIAYREHHTSQELTEVKFAREPFHYDVLNVDGVEVESLVIEKEYVNELPKRLEYKLLHQYLLETQQVKTFLSNTGAIPNEVFRFPDHELGVILSTNQTRDLFGWGECGNCLEESISILRITPDEKKILLDIYQGEGSQGYCQIGSQSFEGYSVGGMYWIQEGKVLVLRLNHQFRKEVKRVRVSWDDTGERVEVFPVD
ncbi:MAG: hypothetical protein AAF804_00515 [Bacteroidota bacterium]